MKRVLFVCLGNICRSPAAEGIFRKLVSQDQLFQSIEVMSCGIGDWHIGQLPDARIRQAASLRGISLTSLAKIFFPHFLDEFDYVLASDPEVLEYLLCHAKTPEHTAKLHLMTNFSNAFKGYSVPDPYYGGDAGFEHVLDILEDACQGLLKEIKKTL